MPHATGESRPVPDCDGKPAPPDRQRATPNTFGIPRSGRLVGWVKRRFGRADPPARNRPPRVRWVYARKAGLDPPYAKHFRNPAVNAARSRLRPIKISLFARG